MNRLEKFIYLYKNTESKLLLRHFENKTGIKHFRDMTKHINKIAPVIIDGGANHGMHTLLFKIYFPKSIVYAFEPQKLESLDLIAKEFDSVHIVHCLIGEKNKSKVALNFTNSSDRATTLDLIDKPVLETKDFKMVSLDDWAMKNYIDHVDIIKIDVEGYDYQALLGAQNLLKKAKILFIEIHFQNMFGDKQFYFDDVYKLVKSFGFKLFRFYDLGNDERGFVKNGNAMFVKNEQKG